MVKSEIYHPLDFKNKENGLHQRTYSENLQSENSAEIIVYCKSVWLFKEA